MRERLLEALAGLVLRRHGAVLAVSLALAVAGGVAAGLFLGIDSNQDKLVSSELDYQRRFLDYLEEFGDQDYLYVVVDKGQDPSRARAFAEELGAELRQAPEHFERVQVRSEAADFGDNLLLLAPPEEFERLVRGLGAGGQDLARFAALDRFSGIFDYLSQRLEGLTSEDTSAGEASLGFLDALIGELEAGVSPDADPAAPSRLDAVVPSFELPPEQAYAEHGRLLVVSVMPRKEFGSLDPIEAPLRELRATIARVSRGHPGLEVGVTGWPALAADEVQRTSQDMTLAAILALVGVSLLFMLYFRGVVRPLLAVASLLVGIAWAAGFATLALGELNFLSSIFTVILIGIGIDFGIHVLARYQGALLEGEDAAAAVRHSILEAGKSNLTASATTALAFYSTLLTDFTGLSQLGLIAGTGVLLCCLSMHTVLPALLYRLDRGRAAEAPPPQLISFPKLDRWTRRPAWILGPLVLLTLVGLPLVSRGARFEENILELQSQREESVVWEQRLVQQEGASTWIAVSMAKDPEQAAAWQAGFLALKEVAKVESVVPFLSPEASARRARLQALARDLGPLACPGGQSTLDEERLDASLGRFVEALETLAERALTQPGAQGVEELLVLQERVEAVRDALSGRGPALAKRQERFFDLLHGRLRTLGTLLRPSGWTRDTLPALVRQRLVGKSQRLAVCVFPAEDVWRPEAMARFVEAVRRVDPDVTGPAISIHESRKTVEEAFGTSLGVTLVLIVVLLAVEFRGRALLALIPLGVGVLWMLEVMGASGSAFNMANFFTVPVLIGIGIDHGVHMVNRFREDPQGSLLGHPTGVGVVLSSFTTLIGFGAMATAEHNGLASIGILMAIGSASLLVSAVLVLPAVLELLRRRHQAAAPTPEPSPSEPQAA